MRVNLISLVGTFLISRQQMCGQWPFPVLVRQGNPWVATFYTRKHLAFRTPAHTENTNETLSLLNKMHSYSHLQKDEGIWLEWNLQSYARINAQLAINQKPTRLVLACKSTGLRKYVVTSLSGGLKFSAAHVDLMLYSALFWTSPVWVRDQVSSSPADQFMEHTTACL